MCTICLLNLLKLGLEVVVTRHVGASSQFHGKSSKVPLTTEPSLQTQDQCFISRKFFQVCHITCVRPYFDPQLFQKLKKKKVERKNKFFGIKELSPKLDSVDLTQQLWEMHAGVQ